MSRIEIQYIIFDVTLERLDLNTIFVMFCARPRATIVGKTFIEQAFAKQVTAL